VTVQVAYSIIDRRPEKKMVAWCLEHNVKILAYGYASLAKHNCNCLKIMDVVFISKR
jgi:diketogulonate reductase-like aldo/keto reductase